ncbi:hypothetical protein NFIA_088110 [Paecilomyces variotii No. 5]|uniref:Gag1-like clamp domain-containing protein n=1 Tax=Byssochlamys spectabilis (strain No. 5 / NBRC 109023) TaxID=1356009 RepID=V5I651_BYSSN|nr:hypothetical protein NFIA_088110 [Paecilomyces variotii No. 5]
MDGSKPRSPSSPTSVFSFHRKPRSPETTTTTPATVPSQQEREAIIREAKRHVRDVVRNDWNYETALTNSPPSTDSNASSMTAATTDGTATTAATTVASSSTAGTEPLPEVVGWRLREYDSSSSEFEPEQAGPAQAVRQHRRQELSEDSDAAVRAGTVERRRRRGRQLEEEMRWNIGLRIWVERRNAWSGARTRAHVKHTSGAQAAPSAAQEVDQKNTEKPPLVRPLSSESTGSRSTVPAEGEERGDQASQPSSDASSLVPETEVLSLSENQDATSKEAEVSSAGTATEEEQSTTEEKDDYDDPNEPLVPLVRPLLPESNPIRSSIKPSLYPSIYSKIVVQGLTPTVPINLADVTRAMVEGWKADGQWPPKPTPQAPGDNIAVRRKANAANNTNLNDEKKRSHGVAGAMKKVLGFSGIHHYPFHRRSSSHGAGGDNANEVPFVEENTGTRNA